MIGLAAGVTASLAGDGAAKVLAGVGSAPQTDPSSLDPAVLSLTALPVVALTVTVELARVRWMLIRPSDTGRGLVVTGREFDA